SLGASGLLRVLLGPLLLLALYAHEPEFVAFPRDVGRFLGAILRDGFTLGVAIILHQRNMAGADVGAATALYAVEQLVFSRLFKVVRLGEPVQFLRLKID